MEAYYARQPILDKYGNLYGYELLFRQNPGATVSGFDPPPAPKGVPPHNLAPVAPPPAFDGERATGAVLHAVSNSGIANVTGGAAAFVNFTEKLIMDGYATLFPSKYLVVEVLESVAPTQEMFGKLCELKSKRYRIALDDFVYDPQLYNIIKICDIIKVEVGTEQKYMDNLKRVFYAVNRLGLSKKITVLAEKVETQEMFKQCSQMGCELFQGYFFAKPITITNHVIGVLQSSYLNLVSLVNRRELDFERIAEAIRKDVALTYKLLNLANSAYFSRGTVIKDIQHAVSRLGADELKKWVSFLSMNAVCINKPTELVQMSLLRGQFCEQVALKTGNRNQAESYFLAGMFSLLSALMDMDVRAILNTIAVPDETRIALTGGTNAISHAVEAITLIELGDFRKLPELCANLNIKYNEMMEIYVRCINLTGEMADTNSKVSNRKN